MSQGMSKAELAEVRAQFEQVRGSVTGTGGQLGSAAHADTLTYLRCVFAHLFNLCPCSAEPAICVFPRYVARVL